MKYFDCFVITAIILIFTGCDLMGNLSQIEAPIEVREKALEYAQKYIELGSEYEWGSQDPLPRTIFVDCSGLVINCYQYACEDFGYRLLFNDTTSYGLLNYTIELSQDTLTPGDLLFMGDGGVVSHVALFGDNDGTNIIFIDSTYKPEEGINGVSERSYAKDDPRFISYGRMVISR